MCHVLCTDVIIFAQVKHQPGTTARKQKSAKSAEGSRRGTGVKICNTIQKNILYSSMECCKINFGLMEYL